MRRQRGLAGAHRPDVEVVHFGDAFQPGEIIPHFHKLDAARRDQGVKCHAGRTPVTAGISTARNQLCRSGTTPLM